MVEYENVEGVELDFKKNVATLEINGKKVDVKGISVVSFIGKDWHVNVGKVGINAEMFKKASCMVEEISEGVTGLVCFVKE